MNILTCLTVCGILSILATLLQIASYVAPMWLWISRGNFYMGIGLWYTAGCGANCSITSTSAPKFSVESNAYYSAWQWNVLRGFESACVIGGVLLCIALVILRIGWATWDNVRMLKMGVILLSVITWICVFVGVAIFAGFYHEIIRDSSDLFGSASFPWAWIMTLIAGIIFVVVTVLLIVCGRERDPMAKIPISGDPKMALTPTMINANNGKKYFVPSPYTDDRRSGNVSEDSMGFRDDKPLHNGYGNRAYVSDDYNYKPFGSRPRSYAEPNALSFAPIKRPYSYAEPATGPSLFSRDPDSRAYHGNNDRRDIPQEKPAYSREYARGSRFPEERSDPVYSHYVERSRPPAGARSVLPPLNYPPTDNKYTDELRSGSSTSYIYRPYVLQKY
ncbi:uncharacterized protein LOC126810108 [Patella vulgata]|uniref:uncharacterized protein LOC126810108 n=1 Tax=Patella vulgata TaxID=6465 RepID=UPI00217F3952|nr:uncharacterized protein LOC126810108 [Patella vulgata]